MDESLIGVASAKAAEGHSVLSDVFVSEEYRRAMAQVYTKRALTQLSRKTVTFHKIAVCGLYGQGIYCRFNCEY